VISQERAGYIIYEILGVRKLSMFQCCQKHDQVVVSQAISDQFQRDPMSCFNCLVTMEETWIHIYIYMIHRPKNETRNGNAVDSMSEEVQHKEVIKDGVGICLLGQGWNTACRLPGKGCNQHNKASCSTS
jgi:hypothetical protein